MAILIGVVVLAVLPNIQRSRESKDIQALDSIASAANAAIATTQAKGDGVIDLGVTSGNNAGVTDKPNPSTEAEKIQHAIFDTVAAGAGKCESDVAGDSGVHIYLVYDVKTKLISVGYVKSAPAAKTKITGLACKYLDQTVDVTNAAS